MSLNILLERAKALKLNGLVENWSEIAEAPWIEQRKCNIYG